MLWSVNTKEKAYLRQLVKIYLGFAIIVYLIYDSSRLFITNNPKYTVMLFVLSIMSLSMIKPIVFLFRHFFELEVNENNKIKYTNAIGRVKYFNIINVNKISVKEKKIRYSFFQKHRYYTATLSILKTKLRISFLYINDESREDLIAIIEGRASNLLKIK